MRSIALVTLFTVGCSDTGVFPDVAYDDRFGTSTTVDIHVPSPTATAGKARPAVMLIHGGAWRWGDKTNYTDAAERLAEAGYVAATINYRLVDVAPYPAAAQDCLCALAFLRAQAEVYGIDPARIAVMGYSAGGHLATLVGTSATEPLHQPDCTWGPTGAPAAAIPGDGIYDLRGEDGFLVEDFLGGTAAELPEHYLAASPIAHVGATTPPFLVVHGTHDVLDIASARALTVAIREAGRPAELIELGGAGHLASPVTATGGAVLQAATDMPEAWAATFDFLARTIGVP